MLPQWSEVKDDYLQGLYWLCVVFLLYGQCG